MEEFKKQNLHIVYKKEIAEWFNYLDQQEFGEKLEAQMMEEIERFMSTKKTVEEILKEIIKEPKWEIKFIEGIEANYFFKSALGYA